MLLSRAAVSSGSALLGLGAAQPGRTVSASALGAPFGKSAEWVRIRTGIEQVRRADSLDELVDLADRAARDALAAARTEAGDVDLVITTGCSTLGITAPLGRRLVPHAGWLHLNSACSGFCYALQTADNLVRAGTARRVLVVAAERMSGMLDPTDLGTSIIFGDGAGAAVVGATTRTGIGPTVSGSDGGQADIIRWHPGPTGRLRMVGQDVFRWAVRQVPAIAREACRRAGVTLADVRVFVPHQANLRIVDAVVRALGLDSTVVADDVVVSGNTSAASIPIALTRLIDGGRTRSGDLALLVGFGAGLSYAAQIVRLP